MKRKLIKIYFGIGTIISRILELSFLRQREINIYNIPIIINNCNRLTYLKRLIESLESRGYVNIIILDNNSSYPPLLEYYEFECKYKVILLGRNLGHLALWKSGIFKRYWNDYYVYTDPDVELIKDCPANFLLILRNEMEENVKIQKIGLGLVTSDLPDHYEFKNEVIEWEKRFTTIEYKQGYYVSNVDTTFALYRPFSIGGANDHKFTLRTKYPYLIHHLPWYVKSKSLTNEDEFYLKNISSSTFWSVKNSQV